MAYQVKDIRIATKARRHKAKFALRIVIEARKANIPVSIAFALIEQESNFRNVFGHDPVKMPEGVEKGSIVTKTKYIKYKKKRYANGAQGVGPAQLTYAGYQDQADRLGGCWKPRYNIEVAFKAISSLIAEKGKFEGIRSYNGSGPAAVAYANSVIAKQEKWHRIIS